LNSEVFLRFTFKPAFSTLMASCDLPPKIVPVVKLVPAAGWRITARLVVQGNDIRVSCVV
jgi:hypothetical protein